MFFYCFLSLANRFLLIQTLLRILTEEHNVQLRTWDRIS